MKPASRLTLDFAQRMVADLSTNNVLRGAWAEQLVAHYLSISDLPPNWSYYDMRDPAGRDISVKHSVGPLPKFSVATSQWAWDPSRAGDDSPSDGWRGGSAAPLQYWCHVDRRRTRARLEQRRFADSRRCASAGNTSESEVVDVESVEAAVSAAVEHEDLGILDRLEYVNTTQPVV